MENLATLTFSNEWIDNLFANRNKVWVGLSGGIDSCVLLHAFASHLSIEQKQHLSAIHIHHGLSDNADHWLSFCEKFCQGLNVSFVAERVTLAQQGSIEEAARNARYQVFEKTLGAQDALLLAHHAGDQVETVLFRLLRGTGGKGLSGMPYQRDIGEHGAYLVRPFLGASKADIEAYAEMHKLQWIEDESNTDRQFTRNYLRYSVVPNLQQRFPSLESNITSTAQRLQTDYSMLAKFSNQQLSSWSDDFGGLELSHLAELPLDEKAFWIRQFLAKSDLSLPHAQLVSITNMFFGDRDRQPEQALQNKRLLRHQGILYLLPQDHPVVFGSLTNGEWLSRSFDKVRVVSRSDCELKARPLGIDLAMPSGHSRRLKKWLNDLQIPSWWREHLPYVFQQGELVAIGDLWVHPEWKGEVEWVPSGELPFFRK